MAAGRSTDRKQQLKQWFDDHRSLLIDLSIVAAISLVVCLPLLLKPWFHSHETQMYPLRLFVLDATLAESGSSYQYSTLFRQGYGTAFFNFYAPFIYFFAEVFHAIGFALTTSFKIVLVLLTLFQGITMYLLGRVLWSRAAGVVAAAFYTFTPYHILNLYWRGDLAEYSAATLMPAVLLFGFLLIRHGQLRYFVGLAIAYCVLILTHNISALVFSGLLVAFIAAIAIVIKPPRKRLLAAAGALAVGIALSAFFWLPAMTMLDLVNSEALRQNRFHYSRHFLSVPHLFSGTYVEKGAFPKSHLSLDTLAVSITAMGCVWLVFKRVEGRGLFFISALIVAGAAFLITSHSSFLWKHLPLLNYAQFPWRLLGIAALGSSLGAAFVLTRLIEVPANRAIVVAALLAGVVGAHQLWAIQVHRGRPVDTKPFSLAHFRANSVTTTGMGEYVPRVVRKAPAKRSVDFTIVSGSGTVIRYSRLVNDVSADIEISATADVKISVTDFPGWEVTVDGKPTPTTTDSSGLFHVEVGPGLHAVRARYRGSTIHSVGTWISLLAFLALIAGAIWWRRRAANVVGAEADSENPTVGAPDSDTNQT